MNETTTITPNLILLSDAVSDFVADAEAAYLARQSGIHRGPVTGFTELDEAISGYLAPGIHVVQAAPGAGKTAFCLQVAAHNGFPALYVTAEMGVRELFRRTVARETETFLGKLKSGELGQEAAIRLAAETVAKLPHLAFLDATRGFASPEVIRDSAEALREQAGSEHVLIVIDSLHVWARSARGSDGLGIASEYELINAGLRAISQIASDLYCPVLSVSHRNRAGNTGSGGMHSGKGSGDIEYEAESVFELTPKSEQEDAAGEKDIDLSIHKNRNGILRKNIPLKFSGRLQLFSGYKSGCLL